MVVVVVVVCRLDCVESEGMQEVLRSAVSLQPEVTVGAETQVQAEARPLVRGLLSSVVVDAQGW